MDAKLKALKVVDLKDILSKAALSAPAKANKTDLINRIMASPQALNVYNTQYASSSHASASLPTPKSSAPPSAPQNDDLLAPPEDVDWNSDGTDPPDSKQVKVAAKSSPTVPTKTAAKSTTSIISPVATAMTAAATAVAPTGTPTSRNSTAEETKPVADEELEKRKQRAARFGVPLVDPPRSYPAGRRSSTNRIHDAAPIPRAAAHATIRQVAANAATSNRKRPAVVEEVDAEELERRKKRAERFAIGTRA